MIYNGLVITDNECERLFCTVKVRFQVIHLLVVPLGAT